MNVLRRTSVSLAYDVWGESSTCPTVLLLHGLAGWSGEWKPIVDRLLATGMVVTLDQRGHGRSTRHPDDVSRDAYVNDVVAMIEAVNSGPVILVGQSLGGHTAMLVAARRPDLVSALVVIEASPEQDTEAPERVREWLSSWPVPFESRSVAAKFFGAMDFWQSELGPQMWADGLDERSDGLWPWFDIGVMVDSLQEIASTDFWGEWRSIQCPTLIVHGDRGDLSLEVADQMVAQLPGTSLYEIAPSGHDVHLDQPNILYRMLTGFLADQSKGTRRAT